MSKQHCSGLGLLPCVISGNPSSNTPVPLTLSHVTETSSDATSTDPRSMAADPAALALRGLLGTAAAQDVDSQLYEETMGAELDYLAELWLS